MKQNKTRGGRTQASVKLASATGARPRGYVHQASPLFTQKSGDSVLYGDPFLQQSRVQYLHKTDNTTLLIDGNEVLKQSSFSSRKLPDTSPIKRLLWVPPLLVKQRSVGGKDGALQGDTRGNFADIGITRISFKNLIKQPIKVIINSPRARISDDSNPYVRRFKREIVIKPGQVKWFKATWGDKANIFTPMVQWVPSTNGGSTTQDDYWQSFVIADFVVIVPDIDEMSGKTIDTLKAMGICEVHVDQRYVSTAMYTQSQTVVYQTREPICAIRLKTYADMLDEYNVLVPTIQSRLLTKKIGTQMVLRDEAGLQPQLGLPEGVICAFTGVSGYYKVMAGELVRWDVSSNIPADDFEVVTVPSGAPVMIVGGSLSAVSLADVIGFLTTVTKILTLVAAFM